MSVSKGTSGAIEGLVYDFYVLTIEGILQERRGILSPLGTSSENYSDNSDYNRQSLIPWRKDVSRLLILDLYMFSTKHNKHILLERWKINYQRNNDSKDSRPFPIINRRILTLVRTIICFIRLLPGFNLLNLSKVKPSLGYQIYEGQNEESLPQFTYDCLKYRFNQVSTSKGFISMGVTYVNPSSTKELIRSVNNAAGQQRSNKDPEKSAAIPIPIQSKPVATAPPDYNSYPASRHRQSASYEKPRIDDYEDQFDSNNSSYSTAMAMNGHRDEDPHQRRQAQNADDLRRRSLQQTHGRVHSSSDEGVPLKAHSGHHQAVSLDHYNSKHSLQHYPFDSSPPVSTGALPNGGNLPSMSPSSTTASVQYLQNYRQQASPSVAMGGPPSRAQQHGAFLPPYPPSNASSQSTPPFSLMEQRMMDLNTYPDPTKASPPYPQFSTSLVSTSPAGSFNPTELAMKMGAVRSSNRRRSFSDRNNSGTASTGTSWQQQPMQVAASPESATHELQLLMALPRSPFSKLLEQQPSASDNRLDVILYEEKRQQQMQPLSGWGGGGVSDNPSKYLFGRPTATKTAAAASSSHPALTGGGDDFSDESSRQFRLSDERRGKQLDFGDLTTNSDTERPSLTRASEGEEEDGEEEEEDMMFAFALNPHEFASSHSDAHEHTPDAPSRLLIRRNSSHASLSLASHADSLGGATYSATALREELQCRLDVFKAFRVELNK